MRVRLVRGGAVRVDGGGAAFVAGQMLRRFEGLSLAPYLCQAGKLTIGYGHVIMAGEEWMKAGITLEIAESLLLRDLAWALYAARNVGRVLTDGQAAALASLIFNIGRSGWEKSTIRRYVVAGQFHAAADEFLRWCKVAGVENGGLLARRNAEKLIFEGASWTG